MICRLLFFLLRNGIDWKRKVKIKQRGKSQQHEDPRRDGRQGQSQPIQIMSSFGDEH